MYIPVDVKVVGLLREGEGWGERDDKGGRKRGRREREREREGERERRYNECVGTTLVAWYRVVLECPLCMYYFQLWTEKLNTILTVKYL